METELIGEIYDGATAEFLSPLAPVTPSESSTYLSSQSFDADWIETDELNAARAGVPSYVDIAPWAMMGVARDFSQEDLVQNRNEGDWSIEGSAMALEEEGNAIARHERESHSADSSECESAVQDLDEEYFFGLAEESQNDCEGDTSIDHNMSTERSATTSPASSKLSLGGDSFRSSQSALPERSIVHASPELHSRDDRYMSRHGLGVLVDSTAVPGVRFQAQECYRGNEI